MKRSLLTAGSLLATLAWAPTATAQAPPPAPALVEPAAGSALVQPITLRWGAVNDPDGPIVSYTWQVSTTSTFNSVIASGSNNLAHESIPVPTQGMLSGIPNGTYFWRVLGRQIAGGESAWSAVRSLTVTGLGPAPGTPSITTPSSNAQFHTFESFKLRWTALAGAHY